MQGCIRREQAPEAAPEAVRQAVGGGCQSSWGRLQMPLKLTLGIGGTVAGHRLGRPGRGGGACPPPPPLPMHPWGRGGSPCVLACYSWRAVWAWLACGPQGLETWVGSTEREGGIVLRGFGLEPSLCVPDSSLPVYCRAPLRNRGEPGAPWAVCLVCDWTRVVCAPHTMHCPARCSSYHCAHPVPIPLLNVLFAFRQSPPPLSSAQVSCTDLSARTALHDCPAPSTANASVREGAMRT